VHRYTDTPYANSLGVSGQATEEDAGRVYWHTVTHFRVYKEAPGSRPAPRTRAPVHSERTVQLTRKSNERKSLL